MTQCTRTFLEITCCMACMIAVWFAKKENATETAPS